MTNLEFKQVTAYELKKLLPYYGKRANKTCDSVIADSLIWMDCYRIAFAVTDKAILWLMQDDGTFLSAMPICSEEDLEESFLLTKQYFNEVLQCPLVMQLADEEAVKALHLEESPEFEVREQVELKDYLYDGEALRNLTGKKLRKKKNHLNYFEREYAGRYEYKTLTIADEDEIVAFLDMWAENKGEEKEIHLEYELLGIRTLIKHSQEIDVKMAGVYVDGQLEAFTIGSFNAREDMAVIHVEKANVTIRGLYQFINREFLRREFAGVSLVNREDDLGQEGMRKAKLSYDPLGYARKYFVKQKMK